MGRVQKNIFICNFHTLLVTSTISNVRLAVMECECEFSNNLQQIIILVINIVNKLIFTKAEVTNCLEKKLKLNRNIEARYERFSTFINQFKYISY